MRAPLTPNWRNNLASVRDNSRSSRENEAGGDHYRGAIDVSPKQLGYDVGCFIGIILRAPKTILPRWQSWKASMKSRSLLHNWPLQHLYQSDVPFDDALQHVLINKIQTIDEIQSTRH